MVHSDPLDIQRFRRRGVPGLAHVCWYRRHDMITAQGTFGGIEHEQASSEFAPLGEVESVAAGVCTDETALDGWAKANVVSRVSSPVRTGWGNLEFVIDE